MEPSLLIGKSCSVYVLSAFVVLQAVHTSYAYFFNCISYSTFNIIFYSMVNVASGGQSSTAAMGAGVTEDQFSKH